MDFFGLSERHLEECLASVQNSLQQAENTNDRYKIDLLNAASSKLIEANETHQELRQQLLHVATNERSAAQKRYYEYQNQIADLDQKLLEAQKRSQLMGNAHDSQKSANTDTVLANTLRMTAEALDIGNKTISAVSDQNNRMFNTITNLGKTRSTVRGTADVVGKMEKTQRMNKMIMWSVVCLLVIAILTLIYLSF